MATNPQLTELIKKFDDGLKIIKDAEQDMFKTDDVITAVRLEQLHILMELAKAFMLEYVPKAKLKVDNEFAQRFWQFWTTAIGTAGQRILEAAMEQQEIDIQVMTLEDFFRTVTQSNGDNDNDENETIH